LVRTIIGDDVNLSPSQCVHLFIKSILTMDLHTIMNKLDIPIYPLQTFQEKYKSTREYLKQANLFNSFSNGSHRSICSQFALARFAMISPSQRI
jgi:hypothetical protein